MRENWEHVGIWGGEDGREDLFLPEQPGILVPPRVGIEGDCVVFSPWPSMDLESYPLIDRTALFLATRWLIKHGWKRQEKLKNLLNDFIRLPEVTPESAGKYAAFAKKYGPLWGYEFCGPGKQYLESWGQVHQEILAVFNIAAALKEGKKTSGQDWEVLFLESPPQELQKRLLTRIISGNLKDVGFGLTWNDSIELTFDTHLGFLNVLWLQVAQMLTGKLSLCVCDGCGKAYVRQGRVPQKGRKNYCGECGERAAKRVWWKENRAGELTKTNTKTGTKTEG